tara:strand:+ start:1010 stop:1231 length:222 start_codon:yes stop_codon:yes gene_type:complete
MKYLTTTNVFLALIFASSNSFAQEIEFGTATVTEDYCGSEGLVDDGVYIWKMEFGETMSDKKHYVEGHMSVLK